MENKNTAWVSDDLSDKEKRWEASAKDTVQSLKKKSWGTYFGIRVPAGSKRQKKGASPSPQIERSTWDESNVPFFKKLVRREQTYNKSESNEP